MPILTPEERIGTLLAGRYQVESILGQGGMGVVLRGKHELTGRPVAIKLLQPTFVSDPELLARFFQEAKASAGMNHPNVVDVLDMGVEDGAAFLVLELLEGTPLSELRVERGAIETRELLEILLPVMDALAAAHERGIVHRDLKPDNIFIHRDVRGRPVPKVLDFGIAKLVETDSDVHTRTGGLLGTPHYMSPEQAQGQKGLGGESDVWSMGVLLYECLSGKRPFEAESMPALLLQICTFDPLPLTERAPQVHPAIARVVHRAITRDPTVRYAKMEELGGALMAAAKTAGIELPASYDDLFPPFRETAAPEPPASGRLVTGPLAVDASAPAQRRSPLLLGLGGVVVLAALLGLGWALVPADRPEPAPVVAVPPEPVPPPPIEPPEAEPEAEPEPAAEPTVVRTLRSDPEGAEVYRQGALVGNTPFTVDLSSQPEHRVELELRADGREPRTVVLTADTSPELHVSLSRSRRLRPSGEGDAPSLAPR